MNITNLIENAKEKFGNKVAYENDNQSITFNEVYLNAIKVATKVSLNLEEQQPVVVLSSKNLFLPSVYLGIAFSNCYYVALSTELPKAKLDSILKLLNPRLMIVEETFLELAKSLDYNGQIFSFDECLSQKEDFSLVNKRKDNINDKNPLYIIFTSGSSGVPKGVVTSHISVVDYVTTFANTFNITENDVLGNQAPLDYIAGIRDIYIPMIKGCKTIFLPKTLFSTPKLLVEKLNEKKVTTICWVSAAVSLCAQLNVFEEIKPMYLQKIFFTGSVLDPKYLNIWKNNLPNALFVNHYGPTEITASCTYFVVDNKHEYTSPLSIGKAFKNRKVFVLNDENKLAKTNEVGEICVSGICLALGYYKNQEKTNECFVQNPINNLYPEIIYRTGDLGYVAEDGNLMFVGRKDNQIKHMGHRVELDEIENLVNTCENIHESCCVYNYAKSVITLFYSGDATPAEISVYLRKSLPSFMIPRKLIKLDSLPKLFNGKIDRQEIKKMIEN